MEDSFGLPVVNGFPSVELGNSKDTTLLLSKTTFIFNFYLNREVKSTETKIVNDADHCLAKRKHSAIVLRRTVSSRETEMEEQRARKSDENAESRRSTHW